MTSAQWSPDLLGAGYEARELPLGPDPDGEGDIVATLVRTLSDQAGSGTQARRAVLYVHGYTDYFFQRHMAEHFTDLGFDFYALDLRKCGRSLRPGQTPHYVSDLALYDADLEAALAVLDGAETLLLAHSTGGLIVPLWLDRIRRAGRAPSSLGVTGLILNSPWFDLQGPALLRSVGTVAISALGRLRPFTELPLGATTVYGDSLHIGSHGEWEYDLEWKPLTGFPVVVGWLSAVRDGQAQLHHGLDIGVPSLVLRSARTHFSRAFGPDTSTADNVLDVRQIARWSGCLGDRNSIVPIEGALHDVLLSAPPVRAAAFAEIDKWIADLAWIRDRAEGLTDQQEA